VTLCLCLIHPLSHHEFGATAAVDPEATVVAAPGLTLDAWRAAYLAAEADFAARDIAPVALAVIGGAGDNLAWRATAATTYRELGTAAAIHPEAALVDTPGLTANARRTADLATQVDALRASSKAVAPVATAIIGGAGDNLALTSAGTPVASAATDDKLGPAATIDPETAVVPSPRLSLDAGRPADLAAEADSPAGVRSAKVAAPVIRGAGNGLATALPKRAVRQT